MEFFDDGLNFISNDEFVLVEEVCGFFPHLAIIPATFFVKDFWGEKAVSDVVPAEIEADEEEERDEGGPGCADEKPL